MVKAYTTRVGEGPFPTELFDDMGEKIRQRGAEFGTTTGRPRRCGWLDAVILRYAARINGLTDLAITKLDVLDGFDEIKICVAYRYKGQILRDFPESLEVLQECEPVYIEMEGWQEDITGVRDFADLPLLLRIRQQDGRIVRVDYCLLVVGPGSPNDGYQRGFLV